MQQVGCKAQIHDDKLGNKRWVQSANFQLRHKLLYEIHPRFHFSHNLLLLLVLSTAKDLYDVEQL
jgi:hypothetical protein